MYSLPVVWYWTRRYRLETQLGIRRRDSEGRRPREPVSGRPRMAHRHDSLGKHCSLLPSQLHETVSVGLPNAELVCRSLD